MQGTQNSSDKPKNSKRKSEITREQWSGLFTDLWFKIMDYAPPAGKADSYYDSIKYYSISAIADAIDEVYSLAPNTFPKPWEIVRLINKHKGTGEGEIEEMKLSDLPKCANTPYQKEAVQLIRRFYLGEITRGQYHDANKDLCGKHGVFFDSHLWATYLNDPDGKYPEIESKIKGYMTVKKLKHERGEQ